MTSALILIFAVLFIHIFGIATVLVDRLGLFFGALIGVIGCGAFVLMIERLAIRGARHAIQVEADQQALKQEADLQEKRKGLN